MIAAAVALLLANPTVSGKSHRLLLRLEPNDIGTAALRSEPLELQGTAMVMHRYDTEIVFRRAKQ